jgi:hypothetical protein
MRALCRSASRSAPALSAPLHLSLSDGARGFDIDDHTVVGADQVVIGIGEEPGLPFAIAGQLAYPNRQSVAIVGDGGFAMLMAEMTTAVQHNLPVKIILLKNDSLAEVKFEQVGLGNPSFGCDLSPIDFVAFARACGAEG